MRTKMKRPDDITTDTTAIARGPFELDIQMALRRGWSIEKCRRVWGQLETVMVRNLRGWTETAEQHRQCIDRERSASTPSWVNSDLLRMADDLRQAADRIRDEDCRPNARAALHLAAGALQVAFGALSSIPDDELTQGAASDGDNKKG